MCVCECENEKYIHDMCGTCTHTYMTHNTYVVDTKTLNKKVKGVVPYGVNASPGPKSETRVQYPNAPFFGYTLTKALNTLTAKEQQRRWQGKSAIAMSLNPGLVGGICGGGGSNMLEGSGPIQGAFYGWSFAHAQKSAAWGCHNHSYRVGKRGCGGGAFRRDILQQLRTTRTRYNITAPGMV